MVYLQEITLAFTFKGPTKMARIDRNSIILTLATQKESRDAIGAVLDRKAQEILIKNKDKFIQQFIDHPVSEEIEDGPNAENISGTLDGKGNLFSFIGFPIGGKPIEEVVDLLESEIKLENKIQGRDSKGRFKYGGDYLLFDYKISIPSKEELAQKTPLPWEPTRSWLFGIEQGISGFTSYIYWKNAGRSTSGLQAKDGRNPDGTFNGQGKPIQLRQGRFENIPYFSAILNTFKKSIKNDS